MSVSFLRIDDRMIHGQTCTRWAREYPCDGLVAVNDKAANNSVIKSSLQISQWKENICMDNGSLAKEKSKGFR